MAHHQKADDERRWAYAVTSPLAPTQTGLQKQHDECVRLYAEVESADMGFGFQFWQVKAMNTLRARSQDILTKMAELEKKEGQN